MLDVAWPELIVIGAVALVAIGPKDMPKVMHALGRLSGKARDAWHDLGLQFEQMTEEEKEDDEQKGTRHKA